MTKYQKWTVELYGEVHNVEYTPRTLFSKAKIKIDGTTYPIHSAKLFGECQELFRLGGERAVISIDKKKKAKLTVDNEVIKEI